MILLALSSCRNPDNEILPTCFDEVKNQGELRTDCGGPNCPECQPACDDFIANQDEQSPVENPNVVGIDCGGTICEPCATCQDGVENAHWVRDLNLTEADLGQSDVAQSASGLFYRLVMETGIDCGFPCPLCEPTDDDGIQNGDEEGVDCGGSATDPCPPPTCMDGLHNGTETGIDCGDEFGVCPECPDPTCEDGLQNIHIELNSELPAGYVVVVETGIDCDNSPITTCPDCPLPTCFDGIQNGTETGVDCGGNCYILCSDEETCNNGVMDGSETGIDCDDDPNSPCPTCPTCDDDIKNGPEFKVDCLDYPIPGFEACKICPSCHDGILNVNDDTTGDIDLFELDVDCGGPNCDDCEQFVKIASIGQGTGGSAFRDQYSYNKLVAMSGNSDTLELDHTQFPGLKVERKPNFGGNVGTFLKVTANQGFALDATQTFVRTVTLFLPIPGSPHALPAEDYDVGTQIPMLNTALPDIPGYGGCIPFEISVPFITYQENLVGGPIQSQKCFRSYILDNETSNLLYTYNFGGVTSLGYYTKGEINGGSLRTANDFSTNLPTLGQFTNLEFKFQYGLFP